MADETYKLISQVTVGSGGTAAIQFNSIPQIYTDLIILLSARTTRSAVVDAINVSFNGSFANLSSRELFGSGTGVGSGADASSNYVGYVSGNTATGNTFGNSTFYMPNYTNSLNKSSSGDSVSENNAAAAFQSIEGNLRANTAAITSISLQSYLGFNIMEHSTAYLYGVANTAGTNQSPAATGGTITTYTSGGTTYWVHTFTSDGTFTPSRALSCDYLLIAGGGAGGNNNGGGGGAGGYRTGTALSLSATPYTVTVGAGGSGRSGNVRGDSGLNSVFGALSATGGGGGGTQNIYAPASGGSGGGSGNNNSGSGAAGNAGGYSPAEGFAGGGSNNASGAGGGGGGSSAVGGFNGPGGAGTSSSITGTAVTRAGGGGSGNIASGTAGGSGGGGNGSGGTAPGSGTVNTGSGGGGMGGNNAGTSGSGGSGIVIVRYSV